VLLARFFWKEKGEAMIHLDAANITPTMIDESIESFANISLRIGPHTSWRLLWGDRCY
jgi:hypothetical protein